MVILRVVEGLSLPDVGRDRAIAVLRKNLRRERRHEDRMSGREGLKDRDGRSGREGGRHGWLGVCSGSLWARALQPPTARCLR